MSRRRQSETMHVERPANCGPATPQEGTAMHRILLAIASLMCAALWLGLLVVTHFNLVTISVGLLIVLYVTGSPGTTGANVPRTHRL